jgi:hypothetical protein
MKMKIKKKEIVRIKEELNVKIYEPHEIYYI